MSDVPIFFVSDKVNLDDLANSRPGGIVRVDGEPHKEIMVYTNNRMYGGLPDKKFNLAVVFVQAAIYALMFGVGTYVGTLLR